MRPGDRPGSDRRVYRTAGAGPNPLAAPAGGPRGIALLEPRIRQYPGMSRPPPAATVPLPDGRRLAFREFGDPAGAPVVWCHGGLVCGADVGPADGAARGRGLRVIAPDRPGIGGSTGSPGRTTGDWADDVRGLMDVLGIAHAGVAGWSMGGQYALAVAALLPERVTGCVVVAGVPPLDDPGMLARLNRTDRAYTRLARRSAPAATASFEAVRAVATYSPAIYERTVRATLGAADAAAMRSLGAGTLAGWTAEAMLHPRGMVEEYLAWARPWGFSPSDVAVPTHVWQGTADRLVDVALGRRLAALVPEAHLHEVPDAGHLLAYARWGEVLRPFST